ncbi:MAG: hypothetical protein BAJALOKI1v1_1460012 [Promethearchaeota archaeon]|nr:MAG: hypothetical protein BAJALOKI1v1_1460012 [Candidatus Lokiarchaeota archaeon]
MEETVNEEIDQKKESIWDKVKKVLTYAPIVVKLMAGGFLATASACVIPGIAIGIGIGLGMSTSVIRRNVIR